MTRHGLYLGRNASHLSKTSQRIVMWVFREQAIYVRKQNENVSVYHLCDPCRQPVKPGVGRKLPSIAARQSK